VPLVNRALAAAFSAFVVIALALVRPAFAANPEKGDDTRLERSWYGWQVLAVDGVAAGLFATAAATDSRPVLNTGIVVYALSAPVVHGVHLRPWPAVGSLALRLVVPAFFGFMGAASVSCTREYADEPEGEECIDRQNRRAIGGLIAGAAVATGIDASLIAFELRPVAPPRSERALLPASVTVAPILDARTLGVAARATF